MRRMKRSLLISERRDDIYGAAGYLRERNVDAEASLKDPQTSHASLQSTLKATQAELRESKTLQNKAYAELLESEKDKKSLLDQKKRLTSQVAEQKKKIGQLESALHRFKRDLEECRSSMSDFKSLKSKFVELCKLHLHNYRRGTFCILHPALCLEHEIKKV